MRTLQEGEKAPRFSLTDKDGVTHEVPAAKSEYTVIYFYPKDNTPGCTVEAVEFSEILKKFTAKKVAVFGLSGGTDKTKASFCAKHNLSVPLLSDGDFSVAKAYGAYGAKKFMGRSYKGIFRKTYILNKKGVVVKIFDSVKPQGHAQEVLDALKELSSKS